MYVLDTNAIVALMNGESEVIEWMANHIELFYTPELKVENWQRI